MSFSSPQSDTQAAAQPADADRIRVMLVDDQFIIAEALRRMLAGEADIDYCYQPDPRQAVASALSWRPTVILQDLVMPQVDGFALLGQFRTHPELRQVPVIVLSSKEDPQLKAQGFGMGARDYLVKWPDRIELLARVRAHSTAYLNQRERDAAFRALAESQQQLARANADLQRMAKLKDEFVATVSHELRTPLTSIRGSLSLLSEGMAGELPEAARKLVGIAGNSCERLVRMINDLLDIERIESGKMEFDLRMQPLDAIVEQAVASMQGYSAQYRVEIKTVPVPAGLRVRADRDRLMQVLINLLSNAIKFSPAGAEVRLITQVNGQRVRMSVIDRGEGMPDEFRDRIFEKFSQADSGDSRRRGGTGLGLNICKRIVEEHGGRIDFESVYGEGSSFHVELPIAHE
ncbi:ATP-binding response regulator [Noviherbaspirillum aridicola]|nr:hybrid sensor histidine kinase/response regulator [Noviherbaspirillum aridicola]